MAKYDGEWGAQDLIDFCEDLMDETGCSWEAAQQEFFRTVDPDYDND